MNSELNERYMAAGRETCGYGFGPIVRKGTRALGGGVGWKRCDCPHNRDLGAGRNSVIYVCRVRGVRLFLSYNAEC
jgi:hypothetical protein